MKTETTDQKLIRAVEQHQQRMALMAKALNCSPSPAYWPPEEILNAMWRFREKDQKKEFHILCHWLMRLMGA